MWPVSFGGERSEPIVDVGSKLDRIEDGEEVGQVLLLALSALSTMSGSGSASSAAKSPLREAARNATAISCWRTRSRLGADTPWMRRRARLANCRVAAGDRSTMVAISSNGTANRSGEGESEALGESEGFQHHQQGGADGVREESRALGVQAFLGQVGWAGHFGVQRPLGVRLAPA